MHWLLCQISNTSHLEDPHKHYPAWRDLLLHHGGYWKKLIKRGILHAIAQRDNYLALRLHYDVGTTLLQHKWVESLPCNTVMATPEEHYGCMQCQARHLSRSGESVHMFKCHGYVAPARRLFAETHCPACLREYHTRAKALAHLRHSTHCRQSLIGQRMHCIPAPGTGSKIDHSLENHTDGAIPFQQAQGPKPNHHRLREFEPYCIRLLEDLYLILLDLQDPTQIETVMRSEIQRHSVSWTICRRTLVQFLEDFTLQDAEVLPCTYIEVRECLQRLCQVDAWPFCSSSVADLALRVEPPWIDLQLLPRALSRQKVILHAYAGRRRPGDIEWYIEAAAKQCPDFMIFVASVDIVIDAVYGDISRDETRAYWVGHVSQGHVVGFFAGPPCNTWSRA